MAFSINSNIASLQAQAYLRQTSDFQSKTINRVVSGMRIVNSGVDAAGLAIANGYRSDQAVLNQGIRNANDAVSTLQTVDSGMTNIGYLLDRARTLAGQSGTAGYTGDRTVLNNEFQSVMGEIDRQAQAVGMNTGGDFAKNLSVFIGGGRAGSTTDQITNGSVAVDLSKATVDVRSLGLNTMQAMGASTSDISSSSAATSLSAVLALNANKNSEVESGFTNFYVSGAGFAGTAQSGNTGIVQLRVNLSGVNTTADLATRVNDAISIAATQSGTTAANFKNAGITASVNTDSHGRQQLVFTSGTNAFQVRAGDQMGSALLGNFQTEGSAEGFRGYGSQALGQNAAGITADDVLTVSSSSLSGSIVTAATTLTTPADTITTLNAAFQASAEATKLGFHAFLDSQSHVRVVAGSGIDFAVTGAQAGQAFATTGVASNLSTTATTLSGGAYTSATNAYSFAKLANGTSDAQSVTVQTTDANGNLQSLKIDLDTVATGADIDLTKALKTINAALGSSDNSSLSKVFAVADGDTNGAMGIRFVNTAGNFSVTVGSGTGGRGLTASGAATQSFTDTAAVHGSGGATDISTQASAAKAVDAIKNAVTLLGQAQAVVGKGQNQFNFALGLASTQVTNLAASESRIRDADLASEAANLTKAQILSQAGVAALAQANSAPQAILSLLKG